MIGYELLGRGTNRVVVLNDWLCDTSTWDGARPYLDPDRLTWAFADLRGYGRSRGIGGAFTLGEAAADVLDLADGIGWDRFAVVGHSMSTLVALNLAQQRPDRVERAVVLTPPPPSGLGYDDATLEAVRDMALADQASRARLLRAFWGDRLSDGWVRFKAERWSASADPEAVAGYVPMFGRAGLPDPAAPIAVPVLAVTGEQDAEVMRGDAVKDALEPICPRLSVVRLADCGHYPMQETPPLLVAVLERFLSDDGHGPRA